MIVAGDNLPKPPGSVISGNQKSHCAISPAAETVRDAGSGGRYTGRNWTTRPLSVRIEYETSRSGPRSRSPASSDTPAAAPGSAARTHQPPNQPGAADAAATHR